MADIWRALQNWIDQNGLRIDRPKGSSHQRFPNLVYPLDYGFIPTTTASDGGGVDVFVGTLGEHKITGLLATFDSGKGDAEIKVLYDCTPDETHCVTVWLNQIVAVVTMPNEPEGISRPQDGQPTGRVVAQNLDGLPIVTISCSSRFFQAARAMAEELSRRGLEVRTPYFDDADIGCHVSETEKRRLTLDFLDKVGTSDLLYVIDIDGYVGISVGIEVGYAFALGKHIVFAEPPNDAALEAMANEVVPPDVFLQRYSEGRP